MTITELEEMDIPELFEKLDSVFDKGDTLVNITAVETLILKVIVKKQQILIDELIKYAKE